MCRVMLSISFTQDEIIIIRTLLTKQNKTKQNKKKEER
jgi:hypothetical protein